jgi:ribosome-binding factor A
MANDKRRPDRVAEAIREVVATFLNQEVKDPRVVGLVTVTGVEVSRHLRAAKVFVSIYGSDTERAATFDGLHSLATHLRARVGRALRLRTAPELTFVQDESITRAARIETLLAQLKDPSSSPNDNTPAPQQDDEERDD